MAHPLNIPHLLSVAGVLISMLCRMAPADGVQELAPHESSIAAVQEPLVRGLRRRRGELISDFAELLEPRCDHAEF